MFIFCGRGLKAAGFLALLFTFETAVSAADILKFNNGAVTDHVKWLDTAGKIINAHDGEILFAEGKYHWYGMALQPLPVQSKTNGGQKTMVGKLAEDYLGCSSTFCEITNAASREAPVMLKRKGFYYLITSGMTGWKFNEANYYRATNIFGPYAELGDPCAGLDKETTFNSQGTYAFAVEGLKDVFNDV
jgi:beta-xylosidase